MSVRIGLPASASRLLLAALALATVLPAQSPSPAPRLGDVQRLPVVTLSMQVGSTEKETRQVTYTPPPGWYVRSHRVDCTRKTGNSSFSVATVPQNWTWASESKVEEAYRTLIDLAGKAGNHGLKVHYAQLREQSLRELRQIRATHHALVVDATARGEGFLRNGGGLDLVVTAELVYVGTDDDLDRVLAQHCACLPKRDTGEPQP